MDILTLDISTYIGPVPIASCLINASGANCTTDSELLVLDSSSCGAIISKSCTYNAHAGNSLPNYYYDGELAVNSTGLLNFGCRYYNDMCYKLEKPYFVSVAGRDLEENLKIMYELQENDHLLGVELNLSCPNLCKKDLIGYNVEKIEELLANIFVFWDKLLGLKLPPYFTDSQIDNLANLIRGSPVTYIVCCNSLGNGLVIDWEKEETVIGPNDGYAGISGKPLKPVALANVRKFRQLLPYITIIGAGGVSSGKDAFEYLLVGADAVQIGTQLIEEGTGCFDRIGVELLKIMNEKGYQNLEDFKHKLAHFNGIKPEARL